MKKTKILLILALLPGCFGLVSGAESLDLTRSVKLALDNNLYMKLARAAGEASRAQARMAASRLLPQVDLSISQERTFKENLTAMGFGYAPGGDVYMLGPFNTFDARLRLVQTLLDYSSRDNARSKEQEERSAELRTALAAQQVAAAAALAYLEVLRSSAAVNSAMSGLQLAGSLRELALNKHEAGTATGLDVLRARTGEAEESMRVSRARTALAESLLRLKHLLGLPLSAAVNLADTLVYARYEAPPEGEAVATALSGRLELQIARADVAAAGCSLKSAKSGRIPSLTFSGSAAVNGNQPDSEARLVGDMGLALRLPLLAGGRVDAGIDAASAGMNKAQDLLTDSSAQVEEETLSALYRLGASSEEVATASMTATMAEQELGMARSRFAAGAGDNMELVNAQTSLSRAKDGLVDAVSRAKEAKIRLTLALGRMEDLKF